jgi:hypothetical protein
MFTAYPLDLSGPANTGKDKQFCEKVRGCTADNAGVRKRELPATAPQVQRYAHKDTGNKLFLDDFAKVYKKLTTRGYGLPIFDVEGLTAIYAGKLGKLKYVNLEKC